MVFGDMKSALALLFLVVVSVAARGGQYVLELKGRDLLLNKTPFKVIGLRVSNALISDKTAQQLIENLDQFKSYGVNTVSVFIMGSRFGDVKGYRPDASLDPVYAARLGQIIEAADSRGMVVLVGCLYWSTSRASEDLGRWTQADANKAIANMVHWLREHDYRNVFVDVDNEGMAHVAKKWDIGQMIDAGHAVDSKFLLAYNFKGVPPANADILIHHSPKDNRRPWIQTEGSPEETAPGGYWGKYSKQDGFYNYVRIGRYTSAMKERQLRDTHIAIERYGGYMLASTWLQCAPGEGIGGPFMKPGGMAEHTATVDVLVTRLQPGVGIRWWLQAMKAHHGPWTPPSAALRQ